MEMTSNKNKIKTEYHCCYGSCEFIAHSGNKTDRLIINDSL